MSPARENHGLGERITDLFSTLMEVGGKLEAMAEAHKALREAHQEFRSRLKAVEDWQGAYPEKLQVLLKDAGDEHRKLGEGIARIDGDIRLISAQVIDVKADVINISEALEGTEPKIRELEAKIAKLRTRPPPPQWKSTGLAIAGLLAGLAAGIGVIAGLLPLVQTLIVAVFGP